MFFALSGKVKESARVLVCGNEELGEMMARAVECCCKEIAVGGGVERVQVGGVLGRYKGLRAGSEFCICTKALGSHLASGIIEHQGFQPPHFNKRREGLSVGALRLIFSVIQSKPLQLNSNHKLHRNSLVLSTCSLLSFS